MNARVGIALVCMSVLTCVGCGSRDLVNLHTVDEGVLLRSGQATAIGMAELRDTYGVRTVINLNNRTASDELGDVLVLGLDYVPLPMGAYTTERSKFVTFLAAVRQAEQAGRVPELIHCSYGQDRTGTAVALYRIIEQGWSADRAVAEMRKYQHWTHELMFPHLDNIVRDAAKERDAWRAATERRLPVEVIRPPAPFDGDLPEPSGVPRDYDIKPTSRPVFLLVH